MDPIDLFFSMHEYAEWKKETEVNLSYKTLTKCFK